MLGFFEVLLDFGVGVFVAAIVVGLFVGVAVAA
jgi:hypothetical protein